MAGIWDESYASYRGRSHGRAETEYGAPIAQSCYEPYPSNFSSVQDISVLRNVICQLTCKLWKRLVPNGMLGVVGGRLLK
jgi:hypothetical protein